MPEYEWFGDLKIGYYRDKTNNVTTTFVTKPTMTITNVTTTKIAQNVL